MRQKEKLDINADDKNNIPNKDLGNNIDKGYNNMEFNSILHKGNNSLTERSKLKRRSVLRIRIAGVLVVTLLASPFVIKKINIHRNEKINEKVIHAQTIPDNESENELIQNDDELQDETIVDNNDEIIEPEVDNSQDDGDDLDINNSDNQEVENGDQDKPDNQDANQEVDKDQNENQDEDQSEAPNKDQNDEANKDQNDEQTDEQTDEQEEKTGKYAGKDIYLTFDDGPSIYTGEILDILNEFDVKATFFVVGKEDDHSKNMYKRIVDEGHTLAMHSYSHKYDEIYKSVANFDKDFTKLWNLLYDVTGYKASIYRFPGGSLNGVSKMNIKEAISYLNKKSIVYYDWNVLNGDATGKVLTEEELIDNILSGVEINKSSIVLMHDVQGKRATVDSLDDLLSELINEGATILPLDDDSPKIQMIKANSVK